MTNAERRVDALRNAIRALEPGDLREEGIPLVKELMLKDHVNISDLELNEALERIMYFREPMPG